MIDTDISPAWRLFQARLRGGESARKMGFSAKDGDVSRFLARFRAANCYRGSQFESVASPTANAYSALLGLFLAWSSFEQLARVSGLADGEKLNWKSIDQLFAEHSSSLVSGSWQPVRPYYAVLAKLASGKLKATLSEAATSGSEVTARQLVTALRNAFVHGQLTPNLGGASPHRTTSACRVLTQHLLVIQKRQFSSIVGVG